MATAEPRMMITSCVNLGRTCAPAHRGIFHSTTQPWAGARLTSGPLQDRNTKRSFIAATWCEMREVAILFSCAFEDERRKAKDAEAHKQTPEGHQQAGGIHRT